MKRHVPCFVEKAGFEPRTLGTKRSAMTTALHAHWCSTGATLVQHWCNTGATLVQYLCNPGATLVQHWCNTGAPLVQRWGNPGTTLVQHNHAQCTPGATLVQHWCSHLRVSAGCPPQPLRRQGLRRRHPRSGGHPLAVSALYWTKLPHASVVHNTDGHLRIRRQWAASSS